MADILSPLPGKVVGIKIKEGQLVTEDDVMFVVEAMKIENDVYGRAGVVTEVSVKVGDMIEEGQRLARVE